MKPKHRLFVHIFVTPKCNLKCKHCFYDAKPVNAEIDYALSIKDIANVIATLCENYDAFFDIEGGEFFLRENIASLFDVLPQRYLPRITITTNGITNISINPDTISKLDEFRISVEGHTDELQREIRGIALSPVLKTCMDLKAQGLPIVLRVTVHKKNYLYIKDMLQFYADLGFTRFSLYEYQSTGRGVDYQKDYELSQDELLTVLKDLSKFLLVKKLDVLKLSLSSRRIELVKSMRRTLEANNFELVDLGGVASLTVDYDGSIGVCPWQVNGEKVGAYVPDEFEESINDLFMKGSLYHICNHCTSIRIQAVHG